MLSEQPTIPNAELIYQDLAFMTRRWSELDQRVTLEIRAFREGFKSQIGKFNPDDLSEAVEWSEDMNGRGYSLYAVRNPIKYDATGSASDTDIAAAFYLWADCDDPASAGNVLRFDGPKWTAAVTTGTVPHTRAHTYWELEAPCADMAEWRKMQETIAAHFGSDKTVVNPSRIMRIGGTVTYPAKHKQERGYIKELTTIRTDYPDARPRVTMAQMARVFGERAPAATDASGFQIATGVHDQKNADHYTEILRRARTDGEKHTGVRDLAASLAGSGVRRAMAEAMIREACPVWDEGVEKLIETAYAKFTPPTAPVKNFDHAPAAQDDAAPSWSLQTAATFTADFIAPEYLIEGVVQRGRLYTLTAPTGSGKTAVMLYIGTAMSRGESVCDRETEPGDVIYMAGENPDDVRGRVIATMDAQNINPDECRLHFIPGTFSIRQDMQVILDAVEALPNVTLVVVDTLAAYFDGDDSNSNAQMLDFARVLRKITTAKSKPAVIVPAHPVKNAAKNNLTPMGGSSLLNEVDGNLCLWKRDAAVEMHWQGKHRGAEFDPLMFEVKGVESDRVRDSKGRIMPTVMAVPLMEVRALEIATMAVSMEDRLLLNIEQYDAQSIRQRCVEIGMVNAAGRANNTGLARMLSKLQDEKLVTRLRSNWRLTSKGEEAVQIIKDGGSIVDPDL